MTDDVRMLLSVSARGMAKCLELITDKDPSDTEAVEKFIEQLDELRTFLNDGLEKIKEREVDLKLVVETDTAED